MCNDLHRHPILANERCGLGADALAVEPRGGKMTEPTIVTFDVREMMPEERHPAIVDRLNALQPGETLRLVSNRDLAPLQAHFLAEHPHLFTWEP